MTHVPHQSQAQFDAQEDLEFFGGPECGRWTTVTYLRTCRQQVLPEAVPFSAVRVVAIGGYYQPERLPDGRWRLHFYTGPIR